MIGIVTVTYGDRLEFISQLITYIHQSDRINKSVIITNGLASDVLEKLQSRIKEKSKFIIHNFTENQGSAKAFKTGIEIIQKYVDYIWLLDDDNLPKNNALPILIDSFQNLQLSKSKDALLAYRKDREVYKKAILYNNPYQMLGTPNAFLGFNIADKFFKTKPIKQNKSFGKVAVAPYGGLYFHKDLIKSIGLPDARFFLYADDHEFSYRITQNKGNIYLILNSVVEDLEKSFHLKKNTFFSTRYSNTDSYNAIFYSVRNNIVFEQNFVNNAFQYIINRYIYLILIFFLLLLNGELGKFKTILSAVKHSHDFYQKINQ